MSEQFHQPLKKIMALQYMALGDLYTNNFSQADSLLAVAKRDDSITGHRGLQYIDFLLAVMNYRKSIYDTALIYGLECIRAMQATKDTIHARDYYLVLGYIYNMIFIRRT